jgi:molybdopterin-guanine dinucleotide biosynthesis protein A
VSERASIAGAILAGGQSRRMGENKAILSLAGMSLMERAIHRLRPQVCELILNVHERAPGFGVHDLTVVPDAGGDHQGPLAGILAALRWAETAGIARIATAAVDTPFFPLDLVHRLAAAAPGKAVSVARSGGRLHPVVGLWDTALAGELERQLGKGLRSAQAWVALHDAAIADWPVAPYDPFFNINQPGDVTKASAILDEFAP